MHENLPYFREHQDWEIELGEFMFYMADRKTIWRAYNLQFIHEALDAADSGNAS